MIKGLKQVWKTEKRKDIFKRQDKEIICHHRITITANC